MKKFFALNFPLVVALTLSLPLVRVQSQTGTATAPVTTKSSLPSGARVAAERIAAAQLKKDLYFVSSDEMAGRDTPSPGLDATAKFLAERLKSAKLKPAGDDNTYFQTIEMRRTKVDAAGTRAETGGKTFRYGEDFLVAATAGTASGALVYVSHGWVIASKNIDAYQGMDVRDKIVIVSAGLPRGVERSALGNTITDAENPANAAQKRGARGVIMITNYPDFDRWWSLRRRALERGRPDIVRFQERDGAESKTQLPTIMPSVAMLNLLFDGERQSAAEIMRNTVAGTAPEAFELAPQKRLSFTVNVANVSTNTQNVVAVLEGKDPVLKNEYVAVGAHYDHVGVGQAVNGDSIYNGADDDGSGTVAVLALAEALARAPRPRRSILFVWHSGEEKGLKGSEYFVEYPTVPLDKIVAQFNIDMIGRSKKPGDQNPRNSGLTGPNEIYVIGSKMMSTALGELSERVNKTYLNLSLNYLYDRPNDPQRLFYRSDHYNYAKKGIPIIFYFDGIHEDYHRPSDTADKIDYGKMEKVTRTIFMTLSEVANSDARPVVDKPLQVENTER
jgi:hypothetical protein